MLIAGIVLCLFGISIGEIPRFNFEINGLLSLAYLSQAEAKEVYESQDRTGCHFRMPTSQAFAPFSAF